MTISKMIHDSNFFDIFCPQSDLSKSKYYFLDVDGVVLCFERGLKAMLRVEYPEYYDSSYGLDELLEILRSIENPEKIVHRFMTTRFFSHLPLLTEKENLNYLSETGKLYFLTNISPASRVFRQQNLERLGISFEDILLGGVDKYESNSYPNKSDVINQFIEKHPESEFYFLDDLPLNCFDVQNNCCDVQVFIVSKRFEIANSELGNITPIDNVRDFITHLKTEENVS